jgi:hypothetical protein
MVSDKIGLIAKSVLVLLKINGDVYLTIGLIAQLQECRTKTRNTNFKLIQLVEDSLANYNREVSILRIQGHNKIYTCFSQVGLRNSLRNSSNKYCHNN